MSHEGIGAIVLVPRNSTPAVPAVIAKLRHVSNPIMYIIVGCA